MLAPKRQAINTSLFYKTGCLIVWQVKTKSTISNTATLSLLDVSNNANFSSA